MAWSAMPTFVSGAVLTAAQLMILVGNLNETAPAKVTAANGIIVPSGVNQIAYRSVAEDVVDAAVTTASTTFVQLASGPAVAITTGQYALVGCTAQLSNNTANQECLMSFEIAIGGSTYSTGANGYSLRVLSSTANDSIRASMLTLVKAASPGLNTFTAVYRVTGGTGTFQYRRLLVIPFS